MKNWKFNKGHSMSMLFLFLLAIITLILVIKNYRNISIGILVVMLASFFVIGSGLVASFLVKFLQHPYLKQSADHFNWGNKNAIVLLGAGAIRIPVVGDVKPTVMAYSRINKAAATYFLCKNSNHECNIIVSGGDAVHSGKSEARVYFDELINLGVKKSDIILETNSMNTFKNAEYTSKILKSNRFDQIFLVTSGIHMRRSLLYFSLFEIHATPVIADYISPFMTIIPVGYNFAITDFAMHECMGIIKIYIYNYFGWNIHASSAGVL